MRQILPIILVGFLIGSVLAILLVVFTKQTSNPLETQAEELEIRDQDMASESKKLTIEKKEVIGFYPYWNLSKVNEVDLSNLTTIYYFAVDLNPDGTWNKEDPGWSRMKSGNYMLLRDIAKRNGVRWGLTIVNLSADSIAKNVNNPTRRQLIINNTISLMKEQGFQDLNIDLEYAGTADAGLERDYTNFVKEMSEEVRKEIPGSQISIDFFSDTYKRPRIYNLSAIGQIVDQVIIMGYDFHRINSIKAGPVAPMFGKEEYEYDIASTVDGYLKVVPKEKLILGVPFYGYEWPTENNKKNAFTIYSPRGPEISSYHRSVQTAKENNVSVMFDDESKSAWYPYFDKDYQTWRQVWFENERSLGIKFDLVNDLGLDGIAIFALGYDGSDAEPLWNEVKLKLR